MRPTTAMKVNNTASPTAPLPCGAIQRAVQEKKTLVQEEDEFMRLAFLVRYVDQTPRAGGNVVNVERVHIPAV
jgi:hypothetical protein